MTQHSLLEAIRKLLPYAEAEQEAFYKITLRYPGRQQEKSDYEDCRHAVSYAYETLNEATRKPMPGEPGNSWNMHCPKCGDEHQIDITVRCATCDHHGTMRDFKAP
jgi:predicted RNA-binding Zn-ribbon protein involved in translation (DUF1610 family)